MLFFFLLWVVSFIFTAAYLFHVPITLYMICAVFGTYFYPGVIREDSECTFKLEPGKLKPVLIAHHCGRLEHPENTVAAIESSDAAQCNICHVDCALTKDYKVVCVRECAFEDLTGCTGKNVSDFNYNELPELKNSLEVVLPEGRTRELRTVQSGTPSYKHGKGKRIPLLEKALSAKRKNNHLWIETHEASKELALSLNKIIEDSKSERRVIWSSSDATGQKQLEDENPDVGFIFSQREILIIYALYYFGFMPYYRPKDNGFLYIDLDIESSLKRWLLWCPSLWHHMKMRGYKTIVNTAAEKEEWTRTKESEVWALLTELPSRVRRHLIQS